MVEAYFDRLSRIDLCNKTFNDRLSAVRLFI